MVLRAAAETELVLGCIGQRESSTSAEREENSLFILVFGFFS